MAHDFVERQHADGDGGVEAEQQNDCEGGEHRGVVHRDLKLDNIMIVQDGDQELPMLLDFGVAKLIEDNPRNYIAQPTLSLSTAPTLRVNSRWPAVTPP